MSSRAQRTQREQQCQVSSTHSLSLPDLLAPHKVRIWEAALNESYHPNHHQLISCLNFSLGVEHPQSKDQVSGVKRRLLDSRYGTEAMYSIWAWVDTPQDLQAAECESRVRCFLTTLSSLTWLPQWLLHLRTTSSCSENKLRSRFEKELLEQRSACNAADLPTPTVCSCGQCCSYFTFAGGRNFPFPSNQTVTAFLGTAKLVRGFRRSTAEPLPDHVSQAVELFLSVPVSHFE